MTDEELERIVAEGAAATEVTGVSAISKPASRPRGRAKGCEAAGAAKIAKERAQRRRKIEAGEQSANEGDAVVVSPVRIPPGWEDGMGRIDIG